MSHRYEEADPKGIQRGDVLTDFWGNRGRAVRRDKGIPDGWIVSLLQPVKSSTTIHEDGSKEDHYHPIGTEIFWPFANIKRVRVGAL